MIKIKIPMFCYTINFAENERDNKKIYKIVEKVDEYKYLQDIAGICFVNNHNSYIIINQKNIQVLVHECLHAVKGLCDRRGIYDEEVLAYLLDYVVSELLIKTKISDVKYD